MIDLFTCFKLQLALQLDTNQQVSLLFREKEKKIKK